MSVTEIKGTFTLEDGSTTQFLLTADVGWQQWGNDPSKLGETVDLAQALAEAADQHMVDEDDNEEDEDDEGHSDGDGCAIYDEGYVVRVLRGEPGTPGVPIGVEDLESGDDYRDPAVDSIDTWYEVEEIAIVDDQVHVQMVTEDPRYGHCDTCGALCDQDGCTADRGHAAAIDSTITDSKEN